MNRRRLSVDILPCCENMVIDVYCGNKSNSIALHVIFLLSSVCYSPAQLCNTFLVEVDAGGFSPTTPTASRRDSTQGGRITQACQTGTRTCCRLGCRHEADLLHGHNLQRVRAGRCLVVYRATLVLALDLSSTGILLCIIISCFGSY